MADNESTRHEAPMRGYIVVAYLRTETSDISVLARAAGSHWVWSQDIEVVHVYLTRDELVTTCREMYGRNVADIELSDVVRAQDPAIHRIAMEIAHEAAHGGAGSALLAESLTCQLAVHILRRYAHVRFAGTGTAAGLTFQQQRTVRDYVREHLREKLSLAELASSVSLSRYHFARRFRQSTGTTPHEFVMRQRVERAKTMLRRTSTPLLDIAYSCGFSDQSHMTRAFSQRVGVPPGRYRARS